MVFIRFLMLFVANISSFVYFFFMNTEHFCTLLKI